jgi:Cysteine-rich secretory protein family
VLPEKITRACLACYGLLCAAALAQSPRETDLLARINHEREHAGLAKLEWNPRLAESAREHAKQEADRAAISHQFESEPPLQARIAATGLRFDNCAENVARGPDVASIEAQLMRSSGHRTNILDADFNAIGIGILESGGVLYVAENFARAFQPYSETQFRDTLIATIQHARQANHASELKVIADPAVSQGACSHDADASEKLTSQLKGWGSVILFTASDPTELPRAWKSLAADRTLNRMAIGVCFHPDDHMGYANFSVASVFYRD